MCKRGSGVLSLRNLTHEHLLSQDPIKNLEEQQAKWTAMASDGTRPEGDREPRKTGKKVKRKREFGDGPEAERRVEISSSKRHKRSRLTTLSSATRCSSPRKKATTGTS